MPVKTTFPAWVWLVYLALFSLSIPWYLPKNIEMRLWFGLPAWLISCILAIAFMAIFTLFIIRKYWKE